MKHNLLGWASGAVAVLAFTVLLSACTGTATVSSATQRSSGQRMQRALPVTSPPSAGHVPCVGVGNDQEKAQSNGIVGQPFGPKFRSSARKGGSVKLPFWPVHDTTGKTSPQAFIRLDVMGSGSSTDGVQASAAYVRGLARTVPQGAPIYPGLLVLPAHSQVRITVTIGTATGCFLANT